MTKFGSRLVTFALHNSSINGDTYNASFYLYSYLLSEVENADVSAKDFGQYDVSHQKSFTVLSIVESIILSLFMTVFAVFLGQLRGRGTKGIGNDTLWGLSD
jgi:hypothetical protein